MTRQHAMERILAAYSGYYDINIEDPMPPFVAEAEFNLHDEQYFLVRSARIAEYDSREIVFFAAPEVLDLATFRMLDEIAWTNGLSRVRITENHKNTDISLFIVADEIDTRVIREAEKIRRYKKYMYGLRGWSGYRLIVCDVKNRQYVCNRLGSNLGEIANSVFRLK